MFKKDVFLFSLLITSVGTFMAYGIYYVIVCALSAEIVLLPIWVILLTFVGLTLLTMATWSKNERV